MDFFIKMNEKIIQEQKKAEDIKFQEAKKQFLLFSNLFFGNNQKINAFHDTTYNLYVRSFLNYLHTLNNLSIKEKEQLEYWTESFIDAFNTLDLNTKKNLIYFLNKESDEKIAIYSYTSSSTIYRERKKAMIKVVEKIKEIANVGIDNMNNSYF